MVLQLFRIHNKSIVFAVVLPQTVKKQERFVFLEKITSIDVRAKATLPYDVTASIVEGGINRNYFALDIRSNMSTG